MKKILIILMSLLVLAGCGAGNKTYVEPAMDANSIDYLSYLDSKSRSKLEKLDVYFDESNIFALNQDLSELEDAGLDLSGTVLLEVVATWCGHCQIQAKENNNLIAEKYSDVKVIQYFMSMDDSVENFYKNLEMKVPTDVEIVETDEKIDKVLSKVNVQYFPTLIMLQDGIVKLMFSGECDLKTFDSIMEYMNDPISKDVNITAKGTRTIEDVKADIGEKAVAKLQEIEDAGNYATVNVALSNMGKKVNEDEGQMVIFANSVKNNDFIELVNIYKKNNNKTRVVLWQKDGDTAEGLNENVEFWAYDSDIPTEYYYLTGEVLPVAFYIENGIVTGAISAPSALSTLSSGNKLFFGSNSIAKVAVNND